MKRVWLERMNNTLITADVDLIDGDLPEIVAMQGTGRYLYFKRVLNTTTYKETTCGWAYEPRLVPQTQI